MSHNPPNGPGPQSPQYNQQPGQHPAPGYGQEPPKKKSKKKWTLGCLGLFVLAILLFSGCTALLGGGAEDSAPTPTASATAPTPDETEDAPAAEETEAADAEAAEAEAAEAAAAQARAEAAEAEEAEAADAGQNAEESSMTRAQQNAVRSAENYIDFPAFSRTGLIEQLEFEDYSTEDATMAVDSLDIDYNEQAAKAAENYLDFSSFSRQGLIDQLVFEGYTTEQATYGVEQTGL